MRKGCVIAGMILAGAVGSAAGVGDVAAGTGAVSADTAESSAGVFALSPAGYIRHWLVVGPKATPYAGPPGEDHVMRRDAVEPASGDPPARAALNEAGPFGQSWHFHDPGRNEFAEFSAIHNKLTLLEYFAFTEVEAAGETEKTARFWAAGAADLWVNGEHVARLNVTRSRNPDFQKVTLPLKKGVNRLCVRLQCLGLRDTRVLFGLCLDDPSGVVVTMPGAARIARLSKWIDGVRAPGREGLESALPAPEDAKVVPVGSGPLPWPAGSSALSFGEARPASLAVEAAADGATLRRELEIPANLPAVPAFRGDRRMALLRFIARAGIGGESRSSWHLDVFALLARRALGVPAEQDAGIFARSIAFVDERHAHADFELAALLRLQLLGLAMPEESAEIRRAALGFRYWSDEPGKDAMCFGSENHSLLFHSSQLLAGRLYPNDVFSASGRRGGEQAAVARQRVQEWLARVEERGFEEFNSGTYMPVTVAAMLNVVDFSDDAGLSARMAAQVDCILRGLALHGFAGGVISPQGRIYRDVLVPEDSGAQALLALATDAMDVDIAGPRPANPRSKDWLVFAASSPKYRPPENLAALVREPASRAYHQADAEIILEKTPAYILTSLAVPATPRDGEHPENDLRPGGVGYQQHLWQATLARDCHVFVNHPGGFYDGTKSRPGYWYGNGLLPRVRQKGNWLQAIYVIADGTKTQPEITPSVWLWGGPSSVRPFDLHPVAFTHAHWPSDSFDRVERRGNWIFGQKGGGMIGLWCSEPLVPHDDILTGRELRANGYASAWVAVCGDLERDGSLETFMKACEDREPSFDRSSFTLSMKGEEPTRWWERSEPMPR